MSSTTLILEERSADGAIATLTFNDPDRLNAMTRDMGEALAASVVRLAADGTLRAVVLAGAGRAFSAGGDLDMIRDKAERGRAEPGAARSALRDEMRSFYKLFLAVRDLPCPTVAAVHGHAVGAGFCVALACDIRLVAREARLGLNFTRLGLHPGMAATWTLPRLVGPAIASELLFTSRIVDGDEAARIGLANRALPADQVGPAAAALAEEIATCAPLANRAVKRALERSPGASLEDQLSFEALEQATTFESEDAAEGIAAAAERRAPVFRGR